MSELQTWLVTPWTVAALSLLPFMAMQMLNGHVAWHKLRTLAALVGSSAAGWLVTPTIGEQPFGADMLICLMAGIIVMTRPAGKQQFAIGAVYLLMVSYDLGILANQLFGYQFSGGTIYRQMNVGAGWLQLAILAAWSIFDGGKAAVDYLRHLRGLVARSKIVGVAL